MNRRRLTSRLAGLAPRYVLRSLAMGALAAAALAAAVMAAAVRAANVRAASVRAASVRAAGVVAVTVLASACSESGEDSGSARNSEVLPVAVASSMRAPFEALSAQFEQENPGVTVRASYLSSGAAYQQIMAGAPFALFVSADTSYPAALVKAGRGDSSAYALYARGTLALWVSNRVQKQRNQATGALPQGIRYIAIANPELAPYGRAAIQALEHMDVGKATIIQGEDAAQAAQLALASADAALLPLSLAMLPAMSESGTVTTLADSLYQPVLHAALITDKGGDRARALLAFLLSAGAQQVLAEYGNRAP